MPKDPVASDAIDQYFDTHAPTLDCNQQARITAAVMELLRLTANAAAAAKCDPRVARIGLIDFIGQLCGVPWETIPFSITQAALKNAPPNCDVVAALKTFVNVAELEPQAATQEVLQSLLSATDGPAPVESAPPIAKLVTPHDISQAFKSGQFQPDTGFPPIDLLNWQSNFPTGNFGPTFFAVGLGEQGDQVKILLETGEIIWVPTNTFLLAKTTDKHEYDVAPLPLLAAARVYFPCQYAADPPLPVEQLNRRIGQFTRPLVTQMYSSDAVKALQAVLDEPQTCVIGNVVSVTLSVDATPYFVTLEARMSVSGAYVTAKLLDAQETVLMRLDTPRQFAVRGVYLFPLPDQTVALVIQ